MEKYPRHKVEIRHSEMNLDEIRLRGKNRKVLVICNTVSKAQKLYKKLEEKMYGFYIQNILEETEHFWKGKLWDFRSQVNLEYGLQLK